MEDTTNDNVSLAAELTAAWLSNANTRVTAEDVPAFLKTMHETLVGLTASPVALDEAATDAATQYTGAVTARKSLASPDHIISMIDGKPYRTLRRHLSGHGLTPEEYRARYNLRSDYPMVAPSYSEARRAMAKKIGLGRKPGEKMPAKAVSAKPKSAAAAKKAALTHLGGVNA